MGFSLFGGGAGITGVVSGFAGTLKYLSWGFIGLLIIGGVVIFWWMLNQERLKIAIIGVKGKIVNARVIKKNGQRFIKVRGWKLPLPYPPDSCIVPFDKVTNLAVMRQSGDDLIPYNINSHNTKMEVSDSRIARQQHALTMRETVEKYDNRSWLEKASGMITIAVFGVVIIIIFIIGKKTICG